MSVDHPKISGFTIVRNATCLRYPLRESVLSVIPLCDEFFINCGDSSDDTLEICEKLRMAHPGIIQVFTSVWESGGQKGGYQLRFQTDQALAKCQHKWCFYLQADEVLHEKDLEKIRRAISEGEQREDIDGVLFDYLHFYSSYTYTVSGRNWYRREVRAFKNGRGISTFRDAQGFRKRGRRLRVVASGGRIFHYGYVRSPESMKIKSFEMAKWWGAKPSTQARDLLPVRHVGLRRFNGTHPHIMLDRIRSDAITFDPKLCRRKWDKNEIKNLLTLLWESIFRFRLAEFRNYYVTSR